MLVLSGHPCRLFVTVLFVWQQQALVHLLDFAGMHY